MGTDKADALATFLSRPASYSLKSAAPQTTKPVQVSPTRVFQFRFSEYF